MRVLKRRSENPQARGADNKFALNPADEFKPRFSQVDRRPSRFCKKILSPCRPVLRNPRIRGIPNYGPGEGPSSTEFPGET